MIAHWLAVEGVQPSIPQNPTTSPQDLLPKGSNANPHLAAANGLDNIALKPQVKHVLSKESQELFAKLSSALIDESNPEWSNAALASIRTDPGIQQLATYLISFFAEKVTHSTKNLFILQQMMYAVQALLANPTIYFDPYIANIVPIVMTCCVSKHLGPPAHLQSNNTSSESINGTNGTGTPSNPYAHFALRDLAASILGYIATRYTSSSATLRQRIVRSCLKYFLDPNKPLGTHYGAISALQAITGSEGVKGAVLPNLKLYDEILKEALADDSRKPEAERVLAVILQGLDKLEYNQTSSRVNGVGDLSALKERLTDKVGETVANQIVSSGRVAAAQIILETDVNL